MPIKETTQQSSNQWQINYNHHQWLTEAVSNCVLVSTWNIHGTTSNLWKCLNVNMLHSASSLLPFFFKCNIATVTYIRFLLTKLCFSNRTVQIVRIVFPPKTNRTFEQQTHKHRRGKMAFDHKTVNAVKLCFALQLNRIATNDDFKMR